MGRASIPPGVASWIARQDDANREAARRSLRKAKPRRSLNQKLRARLITTAAGLMKRSEPSPFAFEAVIRAWLRAHLCLRGWQWADADFAAEGVTEGALNRIGAGRPTWKEGQPEWTVEGAATFERTRCVNCGRPLPEMHRKYCSDFCSRVRQDENYRRFRKEELRAERIMSDAT